MTFIHSLSGAPLSLLLSAAIAVPSGAAVRRARASSLRARRLLALGRRHGILDHAGAREILRRRHARAGHRQRDAALLGDDRRDRVAIERDLRRSVARERLREHALGLGG